MKSTIKQLVAALVPEFLKSVVAEPLLDKQKQQFLADLSERDAFGHQCYSQEGEDLLLNRYFNWRKTGFYIDIGAHHPQRFSNTYFFYKLGWRGINIDAMPGSMEPFKKLRPEDINLEQPIGLKEDTLNFYIFNDPALNGFSDRLSQERNGKEFFIKEIKPLTTQPLAHILDQYVAPGQKIDFMSVDVEGLDLMVLKSNNWEKYRPEYILAEVLDTPSVEQVKEDAITKYLETVGYAAISKLRNTCLYRVTQ